MTDTHVASALKEKRIVVASQIENLEGYLRFPRAQREGFCGVGRSVSDISKINAGASNFVA